MLYRVVSTQELTDSVEVFFTGCTSLRWTEVYGAVYMMIMSNRCRGMQILEGITAGTRTSAVQCCGRLRGVDAVARRSSLAEQRATLVGKVKLLRKVVAMMERVYRKAPAILQIYDQACERMWRDLLDMSLSVSNAQLPPELWGLVFGYRMDDLWRVRDHTWLLSQAVDAGLTEIMTR